MMRVAFGAKCGAFGASGPSAALAWSAPARPTTPKPPPIRRRASRRVIARLSPNPVICMSVHEEKLVRAEKDLGQGFPSCPFQQVRGESRLFGRGSAAEEQPIGIAQTNLIVATVGSD